MADQAAVNDLDNRIGCKQRLVRQEGDHNDRAQQFVVSAPPSDDRALNSPRQTFQNWSRCRNGNREANNKTPCSRRCGNHPSGQQQQHRGNRNQASAQIVENAPAADCGEGIGRFPAIRPRNVAQNPRGDLPVAANPAVRTLAKTGVIERHIFVQLDITCQPHAGVSAFNQIVAQQRLGGKTMAGALVKCLNVIDCLAMKKPFSKQILLRIGNRLAVRIGSGSVGENAGKAARRRTRKSDADARLNDGETALSHFGHRIQNRPVERVRNGCHQSPCASRR